MPSNHSISLQDAIDLTTRFRDNKETILDPAYQNLNVLPISETFDKAEVNRLMSQAGCDAVRFYLGMDVNNQVRLVIVGVDANNEDILDPNKINILEMGVRCPPTCPAASPLNS